jgi:uncharacterized membrane protein YeaQ/YmgE (transglycosylase-associated protein family)
MGGSFLGGLLLGRWGQGWIGAILGAVLLLWLYRKFVLKKSVEVP